MTIENADTKSPSRTLDWYIGLVAAFATIVTSAVFAIEYQLGHGSIDWVLFGAIGSLLILTETRPSAVLRFGTDGMVTPSWAFAFALLLLGSPTWAIVTMAIASMAADLTSARAIRKTIFNVSQVTASLALGALTLFAFGIHRPLFDPLRISTHDGVAMILSGIVVFLTNGVITGVLLTFLERKKFIAVVRQGLMLSMTADASMLAIAPMLVVSLQVSLLMLPLLGTTAFLVFQTARQALRRAHEANHDPLTQLLNRRAFLGALDEFVGSAAPHSGAAVFILDLDKFKEVNDRLGHQVGDHVLQRFALRLTANLPPDSVVARLGGDEFAVLLPAISPAEASAAARAVQASFGLPLDVDGFPLSAGSSIGVAMFPAHGSTPSELLHAADIAMYRAKRYRSGVEVFESFGPSSERGRVGLLADISDAIEREEFDLHYQSQVCMTTGELHSVEALLRWEHPVHGAIAPGEFIALAEQTDLIGPLTKFVVETAFRHATMLPESCRIAINVSARNLQDRHFASDTLAALAAAGHDPARLELEITESAIANDPELASIAIEEFRVAGVTVTIDDFGTGYASFAMLRDLPVDRIKIDRSFIATALSSDRNKEIVGSIIQLAHRLDLEVTAEGVESIDVWDMLADYGCDLAQGFLVSKPQPIDQIHELLATSQHSLTPVAPAIELA